MDKRNEGAPRIELVGVYARVSTEDQAREGFSIAAQRDQSERFCAGFSYRVADYYVDDGYSGKSMDRPQLGRLLDDAVAGRVTMVVFYKLDRLTRKLKDLLYLLDFFEEHGVKWKSITEQFDTTTPYGKMLVRQLGVWAEFFLDLVSENVRMGLHKRANLGRWSGKPPFGYRMNQAKELVWDKETCFWVPRIFEWGRTMGLRAIAQNLLREKVPPPQGKTWHYSTVRNILGNPVYKGFINYARGEIHLRGSHQPLVSEELWEEVQARLRQRNEELTSPHKNRYLLSGILICGRCGSPYRGKKMGSGQGSRKKEYVYYICRNRSAAREAGVKSEPGAEVETGARSEACDNITVRQEEIEAALLAVLARVRLGPGEIRWAEGLIAPPAGEHEPGLELEHLRRRLRSLEEERLSAIRNLNRGLLGEEDFEPAMRAIRDEKALLADRLESLERLAARGAETTAPAETNEEILSNLFIQYRRLENPEDQRAFLKNLVERVVIYPDGTFDVELNGGSTESPGSG